VLRKLALAAMFALAVPSLAAAHGYKARYPGGARPAASFVYPPGWRDQPWGSNTGIPMLFLAPTYYDTEWAALGLEPPPPGFQWVRQYKDLILVNPSTGEVADVVHYVFH
jgi:Nickel/cobalt transporter regulator